MLYGFIYITTNKINNKKYIGQKKLGTKDDKTYLGSGNLLRRAIEKYGRDNFDRDILEYAVSRKQLNDLEKFYIDKFNAVNDENFYNIALGGTGGNNLDLSKKTKEELEEYKRKLREGQRRANELDPTISIRKSMSLKGKIVNKRTTAKAILSRQGKPHTEENILNVIEEIKSKEHLRQHNQKLRAMGIHPKAGKKHSEETKLKISKALKGKYVGELNPFYGKKHSKEVREKLRRIRLENPMSEEIKSKLRDRYSVEYLGEGNPNYGNKWSEEKKKNLSIKKKESGIHKGEKNPMFGKKGEHAINGKKVYAYDKHGVLQHEFNTVKLALEFLGIKNHSTLNKSIKENTEYKGYYWKK